MPKYSFVLFLRNMVRNKFYTLINILGLGMGICSAIVIYAIVDYEYSFDKTVPDIKDIYRIVRTNRNSGVTNGVSGPMAEAVENKVGGIFETALIIAYPDPKVIIRATGAVPKKQFIDKGHVIFTDGRFFKIFPRKWIEGDPSLALANLNQVVLTKSKAKQFFPALSYRNMIGKDVSYNDSVNVTVSGIVEDMTGPSDLDFTEFISLRTYTATRLKNVFFDMWDVALPTQQLFLKLAPGSNPQTIEKQLSEIENSNSSLDKTKLSEIKEELQPVSRLHLEDTKPFLNMRLGNARTLAELEFVAAILLILACFNYINLSTARVSHKAKEIGIRKVLGESRPQLIISFLVETLYITILASILALAFSNPVIRAFHRMIPADVSTNPFVQPHIVGFVPSLIIIVTILAGIYPAFILSKARPADLMRDQVARQPISNDFKGSIRKYLSTGQFVLSHLFIMAAMIIGRQVTYESTKYLGFQKDGVINFKCPTDIYIRHDTRPKLLADELRRESQIQMVSISSDPPSESWGGYAADAVIDNPKIGQTEAGVIVKTADSNYIKLYQINLIAGQNIPSSDSSETCLINKCFATMAGFTDLDKVLGQTVTLRGPGERRIVSGVIGDFNQGPLNEPIKPLIVIPTATSRFSLNVLLSTPAKSSGFRKSLMKIQSAFNSVYPGQDFTYTFFDESISAFYEKERNASLLLKWATAVSIIISSLGLLALVQFTTERRKKEIGIRKVLGASASRILFSLVTGFLSLIAVSFLIAIPLILLWANHWLQNFAFHVVLTAWDFFVVESIVFAISILTLSYFVLKSARANPVESLRVE